MILALIQKYLNTVCTQLKLFPVLTAVLVACLNNTEASEAFGFGTGADNPRRVANFLLVIFCFVSPELKYVYSRLGEHVTYS